MAALGPFFVAEYKPGAFVYLRRNPNFWKRDHAGHALPYLESVRLEIQSNRDIEVLKFSRNDIHLINAMDADYFDKLSRTVPGKVRDAGPLSIPSRCGSTRCRLHPLHLISWNGFVPAISGKLYRPRLIVPICAEWYTADMLFPRADPCLRRISSGITRDCQRRDSTLRTRGNYFKKMGSNFVTVSLPIVAATLSSSPL